MGFLQAQGKQEGCGQNNPASPQYNLNTSLLTRVPSLQIYSNKEDNPVTTMEQKKSKIKFNTWAATIIDLLA